MKVLDEDRMIPLGRAEKALSHLIRAIGRHNAALRKDRVRRSKEQANA